MKKLQLRKIITIVGLPLAAVVAAPLAVSFSVSAKNESTSDLTSLQSYLTNSALLESFLTPERYEALSAQASVSAPYLSFIEWVKTQPNATLTNEQKVLTKIDSLALSHDLKVFLLKNYLEKLSTFKQFRNSNNNVSDRSFLPPTYEEIEMEYIQEQQRRREYEMMSWNVKNFSSSEFFRFYEPLDASRYIFKSVSLSQTETSPNYLRLDNSSAGKTFGETLENLSSKNLTLWDKNKAVHDFKSWSLRFTFEDRISNKQESLDLIVTTANSRNKRTGGWSLENKNPDVEPYYARSFESYTLITLQQEAGEDYVLSNASGEVVGNYKKPKLFGKTLDLRQGRFLQKLHSSTKDLPVETNNALSETLYHIDSASQFSAVVKVSEVVRKYSDVAKLAENKPTLNYLDVFSNAPALEASQGVSRLSEVVPAIIHLVGERINSDDHFRIDSYDHNAVGIIDKQAGKKLYFTDERGRRVAKSGEDAQVNDWHVWTTDYTTIRWSNQTVFERSMLYLASEIANNPVVKDMVDEYKRLISKSDAVSSLVTALNTHGEVIKGLIKTKMSGASTALRLTANFLAQAYTGAILAILFQDWTQPETAIQRAAVEASIVIGSALAGWAFGPVGTVVFLIAGALFSLIKTANGYSSVMNIDDHGLNDWNFQLRNNATTIQKLAVEWSEDYSKGVEWRVEDGWWTLPKLYIKTQNSNNSSERHVELSAVGGGNSFAFGRYIPFVKKADFY